MICECFTFFQNWRQNPSLISQMPLASVKKRRRRNKSSPLSSVNPITKKYKAESDNDSDTSLYFDTATDSIVPPPIVTPIFPSTTNMVSQFTKDDLVELGKILAANMKVDLIKEIKEEIHQLVKIETQNLRDQVLTLQAETRELKQCILEQRSDIDELEQYGRRMCLNVTNIPGDTDDYTEQLESKIMSVSDKLNLGLSPHDIDKCHRLGKRKGESNRKVIIKFTNSRARDKLYRARKSIGDGIFVQENLTRFREQLAFEARQLVRSKKISRTWVAGCSVYASTENRDKIHIKDMTIIECLRDGKQIPSKT